MYEVILADFGFDRAADEAARDELGQLCQRPVLGPMGLPSAEGATAAIVGGSPTLDLEDEGFRGADMVFSASSATEPLAEAGIPVDVHVTDLDKDEELTVRRTEVGKPVVLHAHGDNRDALAQYVPRMDHRAVLPTTQAEPRPPLLNHGGFTDGDRTAFLAHALGADRLVFPGWDLEDSAVTEEKRKKLVWAGRLLHWLEVRRDERFAILDGRRDEIEITGLPDPRRSD